MCGIYGFSTKKPKKYQNIVKALGYAMEERGTHSSGISIDKTVFRIVGSSHNLYRSKNVIQRLKEPAKTVIGHTRFATIGAITIENAHPIIYPKVIGVHNGHVSNYQSCGYDPGTFSVDSQAVFKLLSDHENDYKTVFKKVYGQINLAWTYGDKLYLVKHQNPLFYAVTTDGFFFCSTEVLETVLTASNIRFDMIEAMEDQVIIVDKNNNISFENVEFGISPVVTTLYPADYNGYYGGWGKAPKLAEPLDPDDDFVPTGVDLNNLKKEVDKLIYYVNFTDHCDLCAGHLEGDRRGFYVNFEIGQSVCCDCHEESDETQYIKARKCRKVERVFKKKHWQTVDSALDMGIFDGLGKSVDDFVGNDTKDDGLFLSDNTLPIAERRDGKLYPVVI